MASDILIVYCTLPPKTDAESASSDQNDAEGIARTLVAEKLAACVNVVPGVRSFYRWQGNICDDAEMLAIIKTTRNRFEALRARLVEIHPYDCPEIIALPVDAGHPEYMAWVRDMTAPE
ncbi:MAG: divalent-cation tolerance protein CutA [Proteobacteria bacterium]|nr:divalent-cation tolerance protein CutA [Pseudomonadota bacterium]